MQTNFGILLSILTLEGFSNRVDEGIDNSEVFSDLMGDEVIKRREFIQESISSGDLIVNLDI